MAELANVRLQLANRPENVMLVRCALTGIAQALALDPNELIDIHTAVTEACNNVVQHAYGEAEGPLTVAVRLVPHAIEITVRDRGKGLPGAVRTVEALDAGIGLPVMQTLAHRLQLRHPADGGTEVWMEFAPARPHTGGGAETWLKLAAPGAGARGAAPAPLQANPSAGEPADVQANVPANTQADMPADVQADTQAGVPADTQADAPIDERAAPVPTIAVTLMPGALARAVLPALLSGLAARAQLSTDRLADAQLLADALGSAGATSLCIAADVEPRRLGLRIGPLASGRAQRLLADSVFGGMGPVIAKLVDSHRVERAGCSREALALELTERRADPEASG